MNPEIPCSIERLARNVIIVADNHIRAVGPLHQRARDGVSPLKRLVRNGQQRSVNRKIVLEHRLKKTPLAFLSRAGRRKGDNAKSAIPLCNQIRHKLIHSLCIVAADIVEIMSGPALVNHNDRTVNIAQLGKTFGGICHFRRKQENPVHPAARKTTEKFDLVLDELVPLNHERVVVVFMKNLLNPLHNLTGELAAEVVVGDADAAALPCLHALHHGIGLISVFPRDLGDALRRRTTDRRISLQRLGDGRFGQSADSSDFLQ